MSSAHTVAFLCAASLTLAIAGVGSAFNQTWPTQSVAIAVAFVLPVPVAAGLWMSRKAEGLRPGLLHRHLASILLLAGLAQTLILICPLDGTLGTFSAMFGIPLAAVAAPLVFPPLLIMAGLGILYRMEPKMGTAISISLILGGAAATGLGATGMAGPVLLIVLAVLSVFAAVFLVRDFDGARPAANHRAVLFATGAVIATLLLALLRS